MKKSMALFIIIFTISIMTGIFASNAYASSDAPRSARAAGSANAVENVRPAGSASVKEKNHGPGYPVFSDVKPTDWYFLYIHDLAQRGLARGNPDGTYAPEAPLLVDEFLAFTLRTLGYDYTGAEYYWALPFIQQSLAIGLIDKDEFDRYDVPITRGQIAEIVVRASKEEFVDYQNYKKIFTDLYKADNPDYILKAIELGVLAGYDDRTFRPSNTATRAEAAVMVLRMIDKSYRLELYGDIFFCPRTDLNDKHIMKRDKAEEFLMEALKTLKIRISEHGKAVVKVTIPEVPEGQFFVCNISFFDETGTYLAYRSTASLFPEECITWPGEYESVTEADVSKIGHITINFSVSKGKSLFDFIDLPEVSYVIYKYYYETDYSTGFIVKTVNEGGNVDYDFELTNGIWGW